MCLNLRYFVSWIFCHFTTDPHLISHYLNKNREARIKMLDPELKKKEYPAQLRTIFYYI